MPAPQRVLYLHGFASSPSSKKATFFAGQLRQLGFTVEIPGLDQGDFAGLTITRQLEFLAAILARAGTNGEPVSVIGSSLGGYLAAIAAGRHSNINRLVLLAPAFDFHRLWANELGPERLSRWREENVLLVHHYSSGNEVPLRYDLMQDAAGYCPFPEFQQPALIIHGEHDTVVPITLSERYAAEHANCRLMRVTSGHEMTDVFEDMWPAVESFLTAPSL